METEPLGQHIEAGVAAGRRQTVLPSLEVALTRKIKGQWLLAPLVSWSNETDKVLRCTQKA